MLLRLVPRRAKHRQTLNTTSSEPNFESQYNFLQFFIEVYYCKQLSLSFKFWVQIIDLLACNSTFYTHCIISSVNVTLFICVELKQTGRSANILRLGMRGVKQGAGKRIRKLDKFHVEIVLRFRQYFEKERKSYARN